MAGGYHLNLKHSREHNFFFRYAMDKWGRRWILFSTMVTGGMAGISCIFVPTGK